MSDLPHVFDELYTCSRCGLDYEAVTVGGAVRLVDAVVAELPGILRQLPSGVLRRRPSPVEWAPVEYACHVRDVLATYTLRLHRGVSEDSPTLEPLYGELRATRFGYLHASVETVVEGLRAHAQGFAAEVTAVAAPDWERQVIRRDGSRAEIRTLRWLARQTAHEAVHHRNDIVRSGADNS